MAEAKGPCSNRSLQSSRGRVPSVQERRKYPAGEPESIKLTEAGEHTPTMATRSGLLSSPPCRPAGITLQGEAPEWVTARRPYGDCAIGSLDRAAKSRLAETEACAIIERYLSSINRERGCGDAGQSR